MKEKIIGWLLLAYLLIAPTIEVIIGSVAGASVLAAVGAAALLLTRLKDVSHFELLALKVRLREQSQQVEVTLAEVQKIAIAFAESNLSQLAMDGQMMHGFETAYKFSIHDRVIKSLKSIKVGDIEISEAQDTWVYVYGTMLLNLIDDAVARLHPKLAGQVDRLPQESDRDLPSLQTVVRWLGENSIRDADIDRLVQEYSSILKTGCMNEPNIVPFNRVMRLRTSD